VRQIFELYLELGSLLPVVAELERRGWRNKVWTTRDGRTRGGLPFDKCRLYNLLTNILYMGKVRHNDQVYAGEHEPIISDELFARVQQQLQLNGRNSASEHRNRHGALLRGLLFCKACGRAMSHTFTSRGGRRYRYYTCTTVTKRGRQACATDSLPALEIESAVVDQIRCLGRDPSLLAQTLKAARDHVDSAMSRLVGERRTIERAIARLKSELQKSAQDDDGSAARVLDLNSQVGASERRVTEISTRLAELDAERIRSTDVAAAFADFDNVWGALSPREQARVLQLLVQRVEFDSADESLTVSFHATGIRVLADGVPTNNEEAA
jgi:site-specific DNA recombinase